MLHLAEGTKRLVLRNTAIAVYHSSISYSSFVRREIKILAQYITPNFGVSPLRCISMCSESFTSTFRFLVNQWINFEFLGLGLSNISSTRISVFFFIIFPNTGKRIRIFFP